jgi:integrase
MIFYVYLPKRGPKRGRGKRSLVNYRGRYRLPGERKINDVPLLTTDKAVAEKRLREMVREKEQEAAGLIAPRAVRATATMDISDLIALYCDDLRAREYSKVYVGNNGYRLRKLVCECNWTVVTDVRADSFIAWRSQHGKLAPSTLNQYLVMLSAFFEWLIRSGRWTFNPVKSVGRVKTEGRERRKRRALTDDEVERLFEICGERRTVYLAALLTGLRRGELNALRWCDVHLEAPRAFIEARASTTKNDRRAILWLRDDLAGELQAKRPAGECGALAVFPDGVPSMRRYKADLAAAGIEFLDHLGRRADVHALRLTLGTNLARGSVSPRVAMDVMRHSDIRLTMQTYTDSVVLPIAEALDQLPRYDKRSQVRSQRRIVSGTDGAVLDMGGQEGDDAEMLQIPGNSHHQASGDMGGPGSGSSSARGHVV